MDVAEPGCRRASSNGSAHATAHTATRRPKPASTASTSTACTPRSRRSSTTSIAVDPAEAQPGPRSLLVLRPRRRRRPGLRVRARAPGCTTLRERGRRPAHRAAPAGGRLPAPRRMDRRGRAVLRRAERRARAQRRGVLPADVPRRGVLVEPARSAHGRHARRIDRSSRPPVRPHAKVVVWEHNSHVGDARATGMGARGELNVGQLARQRYGDQCLLVGQTTFAGEVTAATDWGDATRAQARCAPLVTTATRPLLHAVPDTSVLGPDPRPGSVHDAAASPAARAGDRRDLPARDASARATTSMPVWRAVRRGRALGRDPGARATRTQCRVGTVGEPPETFPSGI